VCRNHYTAAGLALHLSGVGRSCTRKMIEADPRGAIYAAPDMDAVHRMIDCLPTVALRDMADEMHVEYWDVMARPALARALALAFKTERAA
jgi:hypothetical protein